MEEKVAYAKLTSKKDIGKVRKIIIKELEINKDINILRLVDNK